MMNRLHENQTPHKEVSPPHKDGWTKLPQPDDPLNDDLRRMESESPLAQHVKKDKKRFFGRRVQ
jgi:hypothetical protein